MACTNFIDLTEDSASDSDKVSGENVSEINLWRYHMNPFSTSKMFLSCSQFGFDCTKEITRVSSECVHPKNEKAECPANDLDKIDEEKETHDQPIPNNETSNTFIPYHVEFFDIILKKVKEKEYFEEFFNEDESNILKTFEDLSEGCKELYLRLFQRKKGWIRQAKIQYNSIDCPSCLKLLSEKGIYNKWNKN